MTKKRKSSQTGASKGEMTGNLLGTQSTNVGSQSISVTLDTTAPKNQNSPLIPNSLGTRLTHARIISAFAEKLGDSAEWRRVTLGNGQSGYALFFPDTNWTVDPVSRELTPLG